MQSQIVLKARRGRIEALAALKAKHAGRTNRDFLFITSRISPESHSYHRPQTKILSFDLQRAA